jgi:hypothetical protein
MCFAPPTRVNTLAPPGYRLIVLRISSEALRVRGRSFVSEGSVTMPRAARRSRRVRKALSSADTSLHPFRAGVSTRHEEVGISQRTSEGWPVRSEDVGQRQTLLSSIPLGTVRVHVTLANEVLYSSVRGAGSLRPTSSNRRCIQELARPAERWGFSPTLPVRRRAG